MIDLANFPLLDQLLDSRLEITPKEENEKLYSDISERVDYIFVDLDGVTFDFDCGFNDAGMSPNDFKHYPSAYVYLPLMLNAFQSIQILENIFPGKVWFLTKPPKNSPYAYSEKALSVLNAFGSDWLHRLVISQDKSLLGTERSIIFDDRPHKANLKEFRGDIITFTSWQQALADLEELLTTRVRSF
jgi:hypothetical protein